MISKYLRSAMIFLVLLALPSGALGDVMSVDPGRAPIP